LDRTHKCLKMLKNKKLALFFTLGMSLKKWDEIAILDREIKPYDLLALKFEEIYFITYGNEDELKY